jgi:hypothetical protein
MTHPQEHPDGHIEAWDANEPTATVENVDPPSGGMDVISRIRREALTAYWRFRIYDWPEIGPTTSRICGRRTLSHTLRYFSRPERLQPLAEDKSPPDERIFLPGFWLADVFTPSTYGRLESGIRQLGLNTDRPTDTDVLNR